MSVPLIRFEVDVSPSIGYGHLSRCKILAQALTAEGARCVFRLHGLNDLNLAAPFECADEEPSKVVVVDRYTVRTEELAELRSRYDRILIFDDHAKRPASADLLLNGNYYAEELDYSLYSIGRALLGPSFSLITPEFVNAAQTMPEPGHVLMTFGLSRLSALLPSLAAALANAQPEGHFSIIVPHQFRSGEVLHPRVKLIDPAPLAALVGKAECVISGLGVTWQEIVATGRRNVGVRLVDNQDLMLAALLRDGFPVAPSPEPEALLEATARARDLPDAHWRPIRAKLDGHGPLRVARALLPLLTA